MRSCREGGEKSRSAVNPGGREHYHAKWKRRKEGEVSGKLPRPSNMHGVEILPLCAQAGMTVDAGVGRRSWGRRLRWSSKEALEHSKSLGRSLGRLWGAHWIALEENWGVGSVWKICEFSRKVRRCVGDDGFSCKCGVLLVGRL